VTKLIPHHAVAVASARTIGNIFQGSRQASSNYGVGKDGDIGLYVNEWHVPITSSNFAQADNISITFELSNSALTSEYPVGDKTLESFVTLAIDVCKRNGIPHLTYTGDRNGTLMTHNMFANTLCPGPYLERKMPEICDLIKNGLSDSTYPIRPMLSRGSKGVYVAELQGLLNSIIDARLQIDSDFGALTEAAVVAFQLSRGLTADGIVGTLTWAALFAAVEPGPTPPPDQEPEYSPWHKEDVEYVIRTGLVQGDGSGNYGWKENLTREQAAALFRRQEERIIDMIRDGA
jgi:hypothetical protein